MTEILELAREISDYTICGEGNVSVRVDKDSFLIKASGTSLHTLSNEDLTLCNTNGAQIELTHKKPSIETSFHAWIMKTFPEINFIAHTHPPHKPWSLPAARRRRTRPAPSRGRRASASSRRHRPH